MDEKAAKRTAEILEASIAYMESAAREVMGEIQRHIEAAAKLNALLAYYVAMLRVAADLMRLGDRDSEKAPEGAKEQP